MKKRWACMAVLFAACGARAAIIDFDSLGCDYDSTRPASTYAVPHGHGGLAWHNLDCANATMTGSGNPLYNGSGYVDGVHTPRNLAVVPFGPPALNPADALTGSISAAGGGRFDLHSLYMAPVWHDNLVITITGWRDGAVARTHSVTLGAGAPTRVDLQFTGMDKVVFQSKAHSGTPHAPYFKDPFAMNFVGQIFALDTLNVTLHPPPQSIQAVPATSAGALAALSGLLCGTAALAAMRRRRRA